MTPDDRRARRLDAAAAASHVLVATWAACAAAAACLLGALLAVDRLRAARPIRVRGADLSAGRDVSSFQRVSLGTDGHRRLACSTTARTRRRSRRWWWTMRSGRSRRSRRDDACRTWRRRTLRIPYPWVHGETHVAADRDVDRRDLRSHDCRRRRDAAAFAREPRDVRADRAVRRRAARWRLACCGSRWSDGSARAASISCSR